jgi:hypothetical protein
VTRISALFRRFPRTVAVLLAAALRSASGWVVAFPIVAALSALGVGSLPGGDRALFAPGGLLLVETLRVGEVPLRAAAQASLLSWVLCALAQALTTALVFAAFGLQPTESGAPFRRALALTPRFIVLGVVDCGLCALTFVLGFLLWPAATAASGDAQYVLAALVIGWALLLSAAISVFIDLARLASVEPEKTLRQAVDEAALGFRQRGFRLAARYVVFSGAGALCVAAAARGSELARVDAAGELRVMVVFALHQAVLIALTGIQAVWVRALSNTDAGGRYWPLPSAATER